MAPDGARTYLVKVVQPYYFPSDTQDKVIDWEDMFTKAREKFAKQRKNKQFEHRFAVLRALSDQVWAAVEEIEQEEKEDKLQAAKKTRARKVVDDEEELVHIDDTGTKVATTAASATVEESPAKSHSQMSAAKQISFSLQSPRYQAPVADLQDEQGDKSEKAFASFKEKCGKLDIEQLINFEDTVVLENYLHEGKYQLTS